MRIAARIKNMAAGRMIFPFFFPFFFFIFIKSYFVETGYASVCT